MDALSKEKPLVSDKNVKKRLQFATDHIHKGPHFWNKIVWSDKSKFNVFESDGKQPVRRPPNPKYTKITALIMLWVYFTASGVGPLVKIEDIMNGDSPKREAMFCNGHCRVPTLTLLRYCREFYNESLHKKNNK